MADASRPSRLVVLAGPTAVGKGTVAAAVRAAHPEVWYSVSATTRPPRPGEQHGVHYWFVSEEEFDRTLQVDLKSPFFLIQQASPRLRDGGRIVNVSSMGTRAAYPEMASYAPAKAGLEALTLLLAAHFGPRGITVNAVLPGATATDMNPGASDPERAAQIAQTIALRRVGQPGDVADVIVFLASDAGRWVTAQCVDASGGQRL